MQAAVPQAHPLRRGRVAVVAAVVAALDLDAKAAEVLEKKGISGLEFHANAFEKDPQDLPEGFFLSDAAYWIHEKNDLVDKPNVIWRSHGPNLGYGIRHHADYTYLKRTFVYHKAGFTNRFMVVYDLIYEGSYIKAGDAVLCHVFQSDNYDPRPNPFPRSVPSSFDFRKKEVDYLMQQLEGLMKNPESFKDHYELDEMYSKCQANGPNGKRADVWEDFTPIKVLGPDRKVMLTLAICHDCNMAYQTGKWDPKKGSLSNNGTKTLKEHNRKCSAQHHIAGNTQGDIHQMP